MLLSVLIPCKNEAENLPVLLDEIAAALKGRDFEVLIIDDGSTDTTRELIRKRAETDRHLRYIRHDKSAGKGAALRSGIFAARGDIILTIDGDGQNNPVYLPQLADALTAAGANCGIACGQRLERTDSQAKQYASRFANRLRQKLLRDNTRDTACGLKAVYRHIFVRLPFFENWQRYLPALVKREGYSAAHIDVIDRERRFGISKYGIFDRGFAGIADLIGVSWLMQRAKILPQAREEILRAAEKAAGGGKAGSSMADAGKAAAESRTAADSAAAADRVADKAAAESRTAADKTAKTEEITPL